MIIKLQLKDMFEEDPQKVRGHVSTLLLCYLFLDRLAGLTLLQSCCFGRFRMGKFSVG